MNRVIISGALALAASSGVASANLVGQNAQYDGSYTINTQGQLVGSTRSSDVIAYTNRPSPANSGFANPDLTATYGDELTLAATGRLQEVSFGVFNAGSSAGAMTGATVGLDFFRASDGSSLGGFSVDLSGVLGTTPLDPGFFREFSIPDLASEGIDIDTDEIIMLQSYSDVTGASVIGVASRVPPTVGSAIPQLYIDATGVGSGPGFFNITDANQQPLTFNMVAEIVVPSPAGASVLAMAGLVGLRRRR